MSEPVQQNVSKLRLFIALTLPDPVADAISAAQAELRRALPTEALRWTRPEQFHLTLKFLGNVVAEESERLAASVKSACRSFSALDMTAAGIGTFPNLRRPRVLWVGLSDAQAMLPKLQAAVEEASAGFTAEEPDGRFSGHVTLARIRELGAREREVLARTAESFAGRVFGNWTARNIEIIRSEVSPKGARYTTLAVVPLPGVV